VYPVQVNSIPTPSKSPGKGRKGPFSRISGDFVRTSTPIFKKPDKIEPSTATKSTALAAEQIEKCKSDAVQGWSRRQIEKTVRQLADQLHKTDASLPSPKEISEFIEAAFRNPSAQVIVPQLVSSTVLKCCILYPVLFMT